MLSGRAAGCENPAMAGPGRSKGLYDASHMMGLRWKGTARDTHWKHIFNGIAKFVHHKSFRSRVSLVKCVKSGSITILWGRKEERREEEKRRARGATQIFMQIDGRFQAVSNRVCRVAVLRLPGEVITNLLDGLNSKCSKVRPELKLIPVSRVRSL